MESALSVFPFWKLRYEKYLFLDVLLYIDYKNALEFMFKLSIDARKFLHSNISSINNAYNNEGLIIHDIKFTFEGIQKLQKLYFSVI
jgi:hypothetical protein